MVWHELTKTKIYYCYFEVYYITRWSEVMIFETFKQFLYLVFDSARKYLKK